MSAQASIQDDLQVARAIIINRIAALIFNVKVHILAQHPMGSFIRLAPVYIKLCYFRSPPLIS